MFLRSVYVLIIITFITSSSLRAQNTNLNPPFVPSIDQLVTIPQSPEATAFQKYGNTPVSYYSGTPNINIPVAVIKGRSIQVPISLTYDASGIKVEQISSSIGLGWNLAVGGVVSRQVLGMPDDYISAIPEYYPYYSQQTTFPLTESVDSLFKLFLARDFSANSFHGQSENYTESAIFNFIEFRKKQTKGLIDTQPDIFSFNVNGLSGTIYIDYENEKGICRERPELDITPTFLPASIFGSKTISGWKIMDLSGTTYLFTNREKTKVYYNDDGETYKEYNSAWYLTSITTSNNRDVVSFEYGANSEWLQPQLAGRGEMRRDIVPKANSTCNQPITFPVPNVPTYYIDQFIIESIIVNGKTRAKFDLDDTDRLDLQGKKAIEKITTYNSSGEEIRYIDLSHSYFGVPGVSDAVADEKQLRLKLDSLIYYATGNVSNSEKQVYTFKYNGSGNDLPSRESMAQDYWGYYNGIFNTTLIPSIPEFDTLWSINGANRTVNEFYAKKGVLEEIKYPTGGSTEYTYNASNVFEDKPWSEVEFIAGTSITGAVDSTDPYDYFLCDDATANAPIGLDLSFHTGMEVDLSYPQLLQGNKDINLKLTVTNGSAFSDLQFLAIYKGSIKRTFCDLFEDSTLPFKRYGNLVSEDLTLDLEVGQYWVMILNNTPELQITLQLTHTKNYSEGLKREVGALKVNKIVDKLEDGTIASTRYLYYDDASKLNSSDFTPLFLESNDSSSGVLHAQYRYTEPYKTSYIDLSSNGAFEDCSYTTRYSSNRASPVQRTIGYDIVSEIRFSGNNFNGFRVYNFVNDDENYSTKPIGRNRPANGRILEERVYDNQKNLVKATRNNYKIFPLRGWGGFTFQSNQNVDMDLKIFNTNGGVFSVRQLDIHNYWTTLHDFIYNPPEPTYDTIVGLNLGSYYGYKLTPFQSGLDGLPPILAPCSTLLPEEDKCYPGKQDIFEFVIFGYGEAAYLLEETTVSSYSIGDSIRIVTKYKYDTTNLTFLTKEIKVQDSKNSSVVNTFTYPSDYDTIQYPELMSLVVENRLAEQIEVKQLKDDIVLLTKKMGYGVYNNQTLLQKIMSSTGNNPLEDRLYFNDYDNYSNPIEVQKAYDLTACYLWDEYAKVIASVDNAKANEIYFEGFEDSPLGLSDELNAHTGNNYLNTGVFTLSFIPPGNAPGYLMDYWYFDGSNWILVQGSPYQSTISVTGSRIDDVRVYPSGAMMTTYTYGLNDKITSLTDPNNVTVYFEYDNLGRLITQRDQDKNLIETTEYHYYKEN